MNRLRHGSLHAGNLEPISRLPAWVPCSRRSMLVLSRSWCEDSDAAVKYFSRQSMAYKEIDSTILLAGSSSIERP
jgi:hypothetical protein